MRKLGLYRFLSGHTGVDVTAPKINAPAASSSNIDDVKADDDRATFMNRPKAAPLSALSVDFVLNVVMRSHDSIVGTKVGDNMQIEEGGKQERVSVSDLLSKFLANYAISLAAEYANDGTGARRLSEFVNMVFGPMLIQCSKARSLLLYYRSVASAIDTEQKCLLNINPDNIQATIRSMRAVFSSGGAPKSMQEELRLDLSLVLKSSIPWNKVDPCIILAVLAMYPPTDELLIMDDAEERPLSKARDALGRWLIGFDDGGWAKNASSACASAFISGQLMPFGDDMDIMSGVNSAERDIGMSVCVFCSLSGGGSGLLWPAVFKGLQSVPAAAAAASSSSASFSRANRSMILLEYDARKEFCREWAMAIFFWANPMGSCCLLRLT